MRQGIRRGVSTIGALGAVLAVTALAGCEDMPTGADRPPIPQFSMVHPDQGAQCAEWHCESGICGNDTAIYGACCTQAVDPEHPDVAPRPTCGSTYCQQYPSRCGAGAEDTTHVAAAWCYNSYATQPPENGPSACYDKSDVPSEQDWWIDTVHENCQNLTWYDFPECYT